MARNRTQKCKWGKSQSEELATYILSQDDWLPSLALLVAGTLNVSSLSWPGCVVLLCLKSERWSRTGGAVTVITCWCSRHLLKELEFLTHFHVDTGMLKTHGLIHHLILGIKRFRHRFIPSMSKLGKLVHVSELFPYGDHGCFSVHRNPNGWRWFLWW